MYSKPPDDYSREINCFCFVNEHLEGKYPILFLCFYGRPSPAVNVVCVTNQWVYCKQKISSNWSGRGVSHDVIILKMPIVHSFLLYYTSWTIELRASIYYYIVCPNVLSLINILNIIKHKCANFWRHRRFKTHVFPGWSSSEIFSFCIQHGRSYYFEHNENHFSWPYDLV